MRFASAPGLDVIAPGLLQQTWRETEVFGAATWLWMHANTRRDAPVKWLSTLLLPPITLKQFVLATENGKPVFYLAWANFSVDVERTYLYGPHASITHDDWASGDRMWMIDWIAPFGHTAPIWRLLRRHLFPTNYGRYLHHHGVEHGSRIKQWHGMAIDRAEADTWFAAHPTATEPESNCSPSFHQSELKVPL